VLDGHVADALIVAALTENGLSLFLVDPKTAGVEIERTVMVDAHNAARVILTDVEVDADAVIGSVDEGEALLEGALNLGRACAAASLNGAGDQAFQTTLEYLRTRKQFGKLIGEFQALQHRAAHLYSEIEIARAATIGALQALDAGKPNAALAVSVAKAKAGKRRRTGGAGGGADARRRRHDRRVRRRPVHEAGAGAERTAGRRRVPSGEDGAEPGVLRPRKRHNGKRK
jgi:alkylation response protein AidB-like acyl-CoA dehydrogenase